MNVYREIILKSENGKNYIFDSLMDFSKKSESWKYSVKQTKKFQSKNENLGLIIQYEKYCEIAFQGKNDSTVHMVNILPLKYGKLSINDYNNFSLAFFKDFSLWKKQNKINISIKKSKIDLELEDIISAKIPRKKFEIYLDLYPHTNQTYDNERLNEFIISVSTFSKKKINWEHLAEYLRVKKKWTDNQVERCIERIEAGIELLKKYKSYRKK